MFLIKPVKGDKYLKKCFSPKSDPHAAKLCLSVVLKFFGEFHRILLFRHKMTLSETSTEILRKFFFLPCLKGANPEENLDLFQQLFSIKPIKGDKY